VVCFYVSETDKTHPSSRARIAGSVGGDVPEKYYVVQNNDMVRVKYILVYTSKDSPRRLLVFLVLSLTWALLLCWWCLLGHPRIRWFFSATPPPPVSEGNPRRLVEWSYTSWMPFLLVLPSHQYRSTKGNTKHWHSSVAYFHPLFTHCCSSDGMGIAETPVSMIY